MGDKNPSDTHVLNDEWTFYLNERPPKGISQEEYERSIHKWGVFATIEGFWRHMNALDIQKLPTFSTLRMFKSGIKPSWEDPVNSQGGKYVFDTPKNITPRLWRKLVLAIIGGTLSFSDQICGVVLSVRPQKDGLQIWNRDTEEVVCLEDSLRELREVMGIDDDTAINYQAHRVNNRPAATSTFSTTHASGSISRTGSLDFNSHVLERKKNHSKQQQQHTEPHGESDGGGSLSRSNGHVRTKEQHKLKAVDTTEPAGAGGVPREENGHGAASPSASASPKAAARKAERDKRKRKEKTEKKKTTKTTTTTTEAGKEKENEDGAEEAEKEKAKEKTTEKEKAKAVVEGAPAEGAKEDDESDLRGRTMSWADMPSDEDEADGAADGLGKSGTVSTRSIDWAEMAEEGEDEVSDTSWLTEDDMSEDLYTPYESEGEESLEAAGLDGSSDAHRLPGRENGGSELSSDDGRRRRTDFKDIRDSPRTRSLSKERGWYDGTGQWQRSNNRQAHPGHRKNGSVGSKYDNSSPIRKSASNADIGPKKYKQGYKINPTNSGNLSRSGSNNFNDSDSYSTYRHKRSTSTSETSNDHSGSRLYHSSQDNKMRSSRRPTPPPGLLAVGPKATLLEPSPLANTSVSPRTASAAAAAASTPTKRTAPPTNPWKSLPATILPTTPKASFATIAGAGLSGAGEVGSTPPTSPRVVSPSSASPSSSAAGVKESPAPPPSSPVITPSKPSSSSSSYAAMCGDAGPSADASAGGGASSGGERLFASPGHGATWRPKDRSVVAASPPVLARAPTTTTSVSTGGGAAGGGGGLTPTKGFKREFFYKPRETMQPTTPQQQQQPQPQPQVAAVVNGKRSRSPRGAAEQQQQRPADVAVGKKKQQQSKPAAAAKKDELQKQPTAPRETAKPATQQAAQRVETSATASSAPVEAVTTRPAKQVGAKKHLGGTPPDASAAVEVILTEQQAQLDHHQDGKEDEEEPEVAVDDIGDGDGEVVEEESGGTEEAAQEDPDGEEAASDEEDGPGESVEAEESVRRTPSKTPSRRKAQVKKTPSKAGRRAPIKRASHRRSRGLVIDFLKAHEQEFYIIFAALMVVILAGTAVLLFGVASNPLF